MKQIAPLGFHAQEVEFFVGTEIVPGFNIVTNQVRISVFGCQATGREEMPYVVGEMACHIDDVWSALALLSKSMLAIVTDPEAKKNEVHTFGEVYPKGEYVADCTLSCEAMEGANNFLVRHELRIAPRMMLAEMELALRALKVAPDLPRFFPRGKWATIQALEGDMLAGEQRQRDDFPLR